jgi:hypothetical protein
MTGLASSGQLSFDDINLETVVASGTTASLGQASFRTLSGVASGQISISNFYGKSTLSQYPFSAYSFTTPGLDSGGGSPYTKPGKVKPTIGVNSGGSVNVPYALALRSYWSDSNTGTQTYQSPRDAVFVTPTTNWQINDFGIMGITYSDVRTITSSHPVSFVVDIDLFCTVGYYIITRSGTPTLSLWSSGSYTALNSYTDSPAGRTRNISLPYTMPALNDNQLMVLAYSDGDSQQTGLSNMRWSIS